MSTTSATEYVILADNYGQQWPKQCSGLLKIEMEHLKANILGIFHFLAIVKRAGINTDV